MAIIPQADFDRPGIAACELALAPESLDEYRTRIDTNAKKNGRPSGKLASNRVIKDARGERLETIWEFHPDAGGFWREVSVRVDRQPPALHLHPERRRLDLRQGPARPSTPWCSPPSSHPPTPGPTCWPRTPTAGFSASIALRSTFPKAGSRCWLRARSPCSSPTARPWASGPTICWCSHTRTATPTWNELAKLLPDQLKQEDPNCEIISCKVITQGQHKALETVVRTDRGPFSMTVIERRFRGDRFDYEVKYTVETKRFDQLAPKLRESLDSFREMPGDVPGAVKTARRRDRPRNRAILVQLSNSPQQCIRHLAFPRSRSRNNTRPPAPRQPHPPLYSRPLQQKRPQDPHRLRRCRQAFCDELQNLRNPRLRFAEPRHSV